MGKMGKTKLGDIVLPVNPVELKIVIPQLNKHLTLFNMGTVNLKRDRDVATATISSLFPSRGPSLHRYTDMPPKKYKVKIESRRGNKETEHLIITDIGVNLAMLIDGCNSKVKEGGGDMYYTLELSEYRNLTVPTVLILLQMRDNGLKQHPDEAIPAKIHMVGSGDTLRGIIKKAYGNGTQSSRIYTVNSAVIEAATKQYRKSSSNNGQRTYPGTVLAIP